jgi:hypothetical protein
MNTANADFFASGRTSYPAPAPTRKADAHAHHHGDTDRDAPLAELVDGVGTEQRHLSVGEVEVTGTAIDDDETQREERVDTALAEPIDGSL